MGGNGPAERESLRFRPDASLGFAPSDIVTIEKEKNEYRDDPRFLMTVSFMGLYGTTTPLPLFVTEQILWKKDEGEDPVRGFLDLFHHRLISYFYRSWLKYRYHIQFKGEGKDTFSERMLGLIGLGTPGLVENLGIPAVRLIRFAGLLTQSPRSATLLEGALRDLFNGIPARIEQFTGRWEKINSDQIALLGKNNCRLSEDCTLGKEVFSRAGSFRIILGPLSFSDFIRFLPGEEDIFLLRELVMFYVKDRLDFDLALTIAGEEIPQIHLSSDDLDQGRSRLGWTTWLCSEEKERDDDTVLFDYGYA